VDLVGRPAWDALARRRIASFLPEMRALNLDETRLEGYLRWWGGAMLLAFCGLALAGMTLLAIPVLATIYAAPGVLIRLQVARRRVLLRDQLVVATVALANTARAGQSLAQGLESVMTETPEPLATELRVIVGEYRRGRPLAESITATKGRLNLEGFRLFATALLTCLERGGRITEALVEIGKSLQENQRLERALQANTASGRMVVLILGAFPFVFLAGFSLINPEGTVLIFQTWPGQVLLLVVTALVYASARLSRSILNIEI
jgi:tight adherence protein B